MPIDKTAVAENWVRARTRPLRTLDPDDTDYSDLEAVRTMVGDARVVCIGESTHQSHEFYNLRHRLARFLVSELGFDGFVIESGFPESLRVNEWVHGAAGNVGSVARNGITYGFGEPREVQLQLEWLRSWNASHARKVSFYGMDVSGSGTSPRPAIEACLQRLAPAPGDALLLSWSDLGVRRSEATLRYNALTESERDSLSAGIAGLVERSIAAGDELAHRCAVSARALDEFIRGERKLRAAWNPRDELMADNVRWILGRHERIVVCAHNGHIQRNTVLGAPMMGHYLAPVLGPSLRVIGTTYASGRVGRKGRGASGRPLDSYDFSYSELAPPPPHTTDALMSTAGLPLHLLDLRDVPEERLANTRAMLVFHDAIPLDVRGAFDGLIHVQHVTPVAGEPGPVYL